MKIKTINKLTDYTHLNLFSVLYEDRQKKEKEWILASRSKYIDNTENKPAYPDAVVIVPFHIGYKKLVIIREFRVPLADYQFGFPAGLLDKGETIENAGKRELFEETGLTITKVIKKSPAIYSSSGMTNESVSMLFVECEGEPTNNFNEASEDIEIILVSSQDAAEILKKGHDKFDVKSWIVMNTYAEHGIL